jgi:nucleoside-diphosphate-sugar epimerase
MLGNQPIQIYGDGGRDFIFVEDLAQGIIKCQKLGKSGQVYNLATGIETKISDVAKIIKSILSSHSEIKQVERRYWDNSGRRLGEVSKSKRELDFYSLTSLDVGLEKTIIWTKSNFDIIKSTISKHDLKDLRLNS